MKAKRWGLSAITCLVVALIDGGVAAAPATPTEAALRSPHHIVRWSGSTSGGPPVAPVVYTPETCAAATQAQLCDAFELTVDLPPGTYTEPNDGLFVSIRWGTNFLQWNLFVYAPDGSLAASGFGVDSNGQAVLVPHAPNGRYTIVAVPASPEPMDYTGEARVLLERAARIEADTILATRLWTVPPFDLRVACAEPDPEATPTNGRCADVAPVSSNPTGWRLGGAWRNSCYADETDEPPGVVRRCLRFSNNIRNAGDGPLILRAALVDGVMPGQCRMQQIVMHAAGQHGSRCRRVRVPRRARPFPLHEHVAVFTDPRSG